jgi:hypothetical protein
MSTLSNSRATQVLGRSAAGFDCTNAFPDGYRAKYAIPAQTLRLRAPDHHDACIEDAPRRLIHYGCAAVMDGLNPCSQYGIEPWEP